MEPLNLQVTLSSNGFRISNSTLAELPPMLKSFDDVLRHLQSDPFWSKPLRLQRIIACWSQVVGSTVAHHTQPLRLQQQQLVVAASTAAWAQNLALQRHLILQKLNPLLSQPLQDIRFVSGEWHRPKQSSLIEFPPLTTEATATFQRGSTNKPATPEDAFQRWSTLIKQQSAGLPLCPMCQCPTPERELQRWSICGHCWIHTSGPPSTVL